MAGHIVETYGVSYAYGAGVSALFGLVVICVQWTNFA